MKLLDKIKSKIPGMGSYYNQKAVIFRNRGDSYAVEIIEAVRIKYNDKPNIHELSTGEKIEAVPKDYVLNMYGQGSCFFAVEGTDDQLVVFKPDFKLSEFSVEDMEDFEPGNLPVELDTDMDNEATKKRLLDKNKDAVNFAILDSRDERFTFLSEELRTADEKYGLGSILWENKEMVMVVILAVAMTIMLYAVNGDVVSALQEFGNQMGSLETSLNSLEQSINTSSNAGPPPGQ